MTITAEQMRGKLLSVGELRERLSTTEPVSYHGFPVSPEVSFDLSPEWSVEADAAPVGAAVDAHIKIAREEYPLTLDAVLEAGAACGMPRGLMLRTPGPLLTSMLNYFFQSGLGEKEFKALTVQDRIAGISRGSIVPFSNVRLLDSGLDAIKKRFGASEDALLVDYKLHHDLRRTYFRVVLPEQVRSIRPGDDWSVGVDFANSFLGAEPTSIAGYMFRWVCTNGAITTHGASGKWSRRGADGQSDAVYEWARTCVDDVLGGLEGLLDDVQAMTEVPIAEDASEVLRDVFNQYKVPTPSRDAIIENMVETDDLTMYGLMQAVTQAANVEDLDPAHSRRLMEVGGDLPAAVTGRCESCRRLMPH